MLSTYFNICFSSLFQNLVCEAFKLRLVLFSFFLHHFFICILLKKISVIHWLNNSSLESFCLTEEIVPQIEFDMFYWAILFCQINIMDYVVFDTLIPETFAFVYYFCIFFLKTKTEAEWLRTNCFCPSPSMSSLISYLSCSSG